jgi:nucleoid-associated protein YgaU
MNGPQLPLITVHHPQPHDIVDNPVRICGIGTGFEGTIQVRIRDTQGAELAQSHIQAGGTGIWGNFHATFDLGGIPATAQGVLEVFEQSAQDGREINKVVVPIVFGPALINPYAGFALHTVAGGETLSALAQRYYGDGSLWQRIFEANRHQLSNPDIIFTGQVLRIPM